MHQFADYLNTYDKFELFNFSHIVSIILFIVLVIFLPLIIFCQDKQYKIAVDKGDYCSCNYYWAIKYCGRYFAT